MAATYRGITAFTLIKREPRNSANGIPQIVETWRGQADLQEAFLASRPVGMAYGGGYIVDNSGRDEDTYRVVELVIYLAPDFSKSLCTNSISLQTAQKAASVTASGIVKKKDGTSESAVSAERIVTYFAPQSEYRYFASVRPSGPRYTVMGTTADVRLIRSVIEATGKEDGQSITFAGANAPGPLVTALNMVSSAKITSHVAAPIPGTPWYDCTDTVLLELA